ncbi:MAG TPA: DUF4846 domain-containing protein [Mucilaginibacter sp.]|jgi:hypothetical protein|nr:DUF4846 domain-containing protein [Mucilaginibacter sp.]
MMKATIAFLIIITFANTGPDTVSNRFKVPDGYHQVVATPGSFAEYIENLPLKPAGAHTLTYKGAAAATDPFTAAVVDMSVGKEDLQQCADAVMRLRGEYLYHQKRYTEIAFHFESGFRCGYIQYANGYRYVKGRWLLKAKTDYGYKTFMNYMNLVFAYAGTPSLEKGLYKVTDPEKLKAGDVFIKGGSPGHCFIVMDVAENSQHKKLFLLAQSFMPAQNIQVLQYEENPWFSMDVKTGIWYGNLVDMAYLRSFEKS